MTNPARVAIAGWCAVALAFAVACGGGGPGDGETLRATRGVGQTPVATSGASTTATVEPGSSATAVPPSSASGSGGDQGVQDGPGRFFVDAAGGADEEAGNRAAPFATITRALQAAAGSNGTIYVARGTYTEEVSLISGVTISGGYEPGTWRQDAPSATAIEGTMRADGSTGVTLDSLQIRGSQDSAALIVAAKGGVDVRNSTLIARKGSDGADGLRGQDGLRGVDGKPGMDAHGCPPGPEGGDGGASVSGDAGGHGGAGGAGGGFDGSTNTFFGISGWAHGGFGGKGGAAYQGGAPGGSGGDGATESLPNAGRPFGAVDPSGQYFTSDGGIMGTRIIATSGGGGGGGGGALVFACGGGGGGGGGAGRSGEDSPKGGRGGQASIAVIAAGGSHVTLRGCLLRTGGGGEGGAGATGGAGGPGGKGGRGGAAFGAQGAGGSGGDGGTGASGFDSSGGGGGPSIGVVTDAASTAEINGTTFDLGPAGNGGPPPRANQAFAGFAGADGLRAETYRYTRPFSP